MKKTTKKVVCAGGSAMLVASGCLIPEAMAQSFEGAGASSSDTIVVTAQRREQDIQDVPLSVLALSGDALADRQIDSFDQLQFVAPGLVFRAGINPRQSATSIRGIGTGLFNTGIEGSVAVVVDGVVLGREGAGLFDLIDLERVEVLRGPQGTLFGKNASAGVISIVTANPSDEFEAYGRVAYGSYNELNLTGVVSGPVSDNVSFRMTGYRNTRDGYVDNIFPDARQDELNERNEFGIRGKVNFDLGGDARLLVSGDFVRRDQDAGALTLLSTSQGGAGQGLLGFGVPVVGPTAAGFGVNPGPENLDVAVDEIYFQESEAYGVSARYENSFGDFDFVSITAYRGWTSDDNNDADNTPLPLLSPNRSDLDQEQFSQELQLIDSTGQLRYTLGAFAFYQEIDEIAQQGGTAGLDLLGALPPGTLVGTTMDAEIEETNLALYGQAEYDFTDAFTTFAGLRVLRSELSGSNQRTVIEGRPAPFPGQNVDAAPLTADEDDTAVVWRVGGQYRFTDDLQLFASAARGYKSAGLVTGLAAEPVTPGGTDLPTVDPEIPLQFELGLRSQWFGRSLTVNLTGFHTQIDDFQAQALVPTESGLAQFLVTNAGSVETYGFEGDVIYQPTAGLTLQSTFAYTKATYDDFGDAPCYPLQPVGPNNCVDTTGNGVGEFQDLGGQTLANAPEWVVNGLARYERPLNVNTSAFAQLGVQYRGETISDNRGDPATIIDSYTLVDVSAGLNLYGGRATVSVFGRNITDEFFPESIVGQPFDTGGYAQFLSLEALQTWGGEVVVRF
ncbi:MAG: TonB-dependent receptor [Pseudomonadota bacterium]